MNMRQLFDKYHSGFDNFGAWFDHHEAMHRRYPLGVPEFGAQWLELWNALWRVLAMPARFEYRERTVWRLWADGTCRAMLSFGLSVTDAGSVGPGSRVRVVLLDGTVIREWVGRSD